MTALCHCMDALGGEDEHHFADSQSISLATELLELSSRGHSWLLAELQRRHPHFWGGTAFPVLRMCGDLKVAG